MRVFLRIAAVLIGFAFIGLGSYLIIYKHSSQTLKEKTININAIQPATRKGLSAFFGAALIVTGGTLIALQLFIRKK